METRTVRNAAWIIGTKLVQSILALIVSMLTARYLGPANYGLLNYAISIVAFFTPIMRLGINGIMVQEIVKNTEDEGQTIGTAITLNCISGILSLIGIFAFVSIVNVGERETIIVCVLYSISMLMEAVHIIQYWFQAKLLSKYPSLASLSAYVCISIYQIYLLATGKSVYWFAISKAVEICIVDIWLLVLYYRCGGTKLSFSWKNGKRMFSQSKYFIIADLMIVVFAQTDRIMLKMLIDDTATGYYSAAVTCAGMTSFIFVAIIDSFRPSIFSCKETESALFEKRMVQLYSIITYFALAQSVVISLMAHLVIGILYGTAYQPAIVALRIVVWYTTFSYLGSVRNVWILAKGKQKIIWKINLSGAAANVFLNAVLIPVWGINGAAFASLITQVFTNVVTGYIFSEIRDSNRLLIKGLDIRNCMRQIKCLIAK